MRVLWLTYTSTATADIDKEKVSERGWITSLMNAINEVEDISLGVVFFDQNNSKNFILNNVQYYPLKMKYQTAFGKIYQRVFCKLYDTNLSGIKNAIDDFNPDVIHLFGTESGMVDVLNITSVPVIVHLQGLVRPYLSVWFPKGMSQFTVLLNSTLRATLFLVGYHFEYRLFKKRAAREDDAIKKSTFFFGRTKWDKQYIDLLKTDYNYFHCEELLRQVFYTKKWVYPEGRTFRIVSVINPQIYKGLEIVLETASILKRLSLNIEWHIVGISEADELVSVIENSSEHKFSSCNITFKGIKSSEGLIDELLSSSIYVHPSHIENSPNSVCEAMLLGMPVVAGNVGGLDSIIDNNHDGILYKSYDAYDLAAIIKRAIEEPDTFVEFGIKARSRALERHDGKSIASTVVDSYRNVI